MRISCLAAAAIAAATITTAVAAPRALMPRADATSNVTQAQRAMLQEKLALVAEIVRSAGAEQPSAHVSAEQQRWMLQSLYMLPLSELRAIGRPAGYDAAAAAIARTAVKLASSKDGLAKLGQANTELVYYPITPCRFIDTRPPPFGDGSGPIVVSRAYDLDLTGAAYTGNLANTCNPKAVVGNQANNMAAIAINLAIIGPSQFPGFMGVRPFGSGQQTSFVNWYEAGPHVQVSNAGIVQTDQTFADDEIEFFGTSAHIVVDVFGVFGAPTASPLECVQGTLTTTTVTSGAPTFSLNAGACPLNYRMVSNSCQALGADPGGVRLSQMGVIDATTASCEGTYSGATSADVTNTPWCCRVPGR